LQRRFDAAVREKELQRIPRVKADPDFIPEHLRARQAA
jgi:hypothetical protein